MIFGGINILELCAQIPVLMFSLSFHEFFHSFTAYKMGDYSQKSEGRLTLNPLVHIDWIGFFMVLVARFGWAKPVMIDPNNFAKGEGGEADNRRMKRAMALTAAAGPAANLLLALIAAIILAPLSVHYLDVRFFMVFTDIMSAEFQIPMYARVIMMLLGNMLQLNLVLAVFNMLPIPPLDGSKIFSAFLSPRLYFKFIRGSSVTSIIFVVLILTGAADRVLSPIISFLYLGFFYLSLLIL
ncbi:MAG: site-2 protease family protein [Clostridiales bacterium]|jgi:Zn-dependent protease|nr:site-2 protease family protein [Clostridiales bacterium]